MSCWAPALWLKIDEMSLICRAGHQHSMQLPLISVWVSLLISGRAGFGLWSKYCVSYGSRALGGHLSELLLSKDSGLRFAAVPPPWFDFDVYFFISWHEDVIQPEEADSQLVEVSVRVFFLLTNLSQTFRARSCLFQWAHYNQKPLPHPWR